MTEEEIKNYLEKEVNNKIKHIISVELVKQQRDIFECLEPKVLKKIYKRYLEKEDYETCSIILDIIKKKK